MVIQFFSTLHFSHIFYTDSNWQLLQYHYFILSLWTNIENFLLNYLFHRFLCYMVRAYILDQQSVYLLDTINLMVFHLCKPIAGEGWGCLQSSPLLLVELPTDFNVNRGDFRVPDTCWTCHPRLWWRGLSGPRYLPLVPIHIIFIIVYFIFVFMNHLLKSCKRVWAS